MSTPPIPVKVSLASLIDQLELILFASPLKIS
jgi:hypothetical protein